MQGSLLRGRLKLKKQPCHPLQSCPPLGAPRRRVGANVSLGFLPPTSPVGPCGGSSAPKLEARCFCGMGLAREASVDNAALSTSSEQHKIVTPALSAVLSSLSQSNRTLETDMLGS